MGWMKDARDAKRAAGELERARKFVTDYQRDHRKRPQDVGTPWTRDNVCKANGHKPGKGVGC